jgi:hypothetical protein
MSSQLFSDGVGGIAIIGGVARIDLITLSPTEKDANGQPKPIFQQQIVMGAEAFLRSAEKMHGAAQALAKLAAQQVNAAQTTDRQSSEPERPTPVSPEPSAKRPFP